MLAVVGSEWDRVDKDVLFKMVDKMAITTNSNEDHFILGCSEARLVATS